MKLGNSDNSWYIHGVWRSFWNTLYTLTQFSQQPYARGTIITLFYVQGTQGTESFSTFPKATQPIRGRTDSLAILRGGHESQGAKLTKVYHRENCGLCSKSFIDCGGYMRLTSGSYNVSQANNNATLIHSEQILFCSSRSLYSYRSMVAWLMTPSPPKDAMSQSWEPVTLHGNRGPVGVDLEI